MCVADKNFLSSRWNCISKFARSSQVPLLYLLIGRDFAAFKPHYKQDARHCVAIFHPKHPPAFCEFTIFSGWGPNMRVAKPVMTAWSQCRKTIHSPKKIHMTKRKHGQTALSKQLECTVPLLNKQGCRKREDVNKNSKTASLTTPYDFPLWEIWLFLHSSPPTEYQISLNHMEWESIQ